MIEWGTVGANFESQHTANDSRTKDNTSRERPVRRLQCKSYSAPSPKLSLFDRDYLLRGQVISFRDSLISRLILVYSIALILLAAPLLTSCPPRNAPELGSESDPIKMVFVPSTEAEKLVETVKPLDRLLFEKTGLYFRSVVLPHYIGAVESLGAGDSQVAWIPPLAYLLANSKYGAIVALKAVRKGSANYFGQILVRADSDIKNISDLKGRTFAFVDPTSTSGHLYPRTLLLEAGIDPDKDLKRAVFAGSHDAVVAAVYNGQVDAGATYVDTRERVKRNIPDVFEKTRVIATTDPIPGDAVVFSKELTPEMKERIAKALREIVKEPAGRKVLWDIYEIEDLVPASDQNYDVVRKMTSILGLDLEKEVARK